MAPRWGRWLLAVGCWLLAGIVLLLVALAIALMLGKGAQGWRWSRGEELAQLLPRRWPRAVAALTAGMMLAMAGTLIQKLTANPMGSPEVFGISAGAATGIILLLFLMPGDTSAWQLPVGSAGAALTLLVMITIASRGGFSIQRMLLAGIALSTAFSTVLKLLLASGDPRMSGVITWISGSTYGVESEQAIKTAGVVLVLVLMVLMVPLCQRWLRILPLRSVTAQALGAAVTPVRLLILLLASVLTAMATLTVGPLSFVGLMAPHLARMILFPNQVPAGLLATFIGAPYFIYLLRKQVH